MGEVVGVGVGGSVVVCGVCRWLGRGWRGVAVHRGGGRVPGRCALDGVAEAAEAGEDGVALERQAALADEACVGALQTHGEFADGGFVLLVFDVVIGVSEVGPSDVEAASLEQVERFFWEQPHAVLGVALAHCAEEHSMGFVDACYAVSSRCVWAVLGDEMGLCLMESWPREGRVHGIAGGFERGGL